MLMVVTKHRICHWESEVASSLDSGAFVIVGRGAPGGKAHWTAGVVHSEKLVGFQVPG